MMQRNNRLRFLVQIQVTVLLMILLSGILSTNTYAYSDQYCEGVYKTDLKQLKGYMYAEDIRIVGDSDNVLFVLHSKGMGGLISYDMKADRVTGRFISGLGHTIYNNKNTKIITYGNVTEGKTKKKTKFAIYDTKTFKLLKSFSIDRFEFTSNPDIKEILVSTDDKYLFVYEYINGENIDSSLISSANAQGRVEYEKIMNLHIIDLVNNKYVKRIRLDNLDVDLYGEILQLENINSNELRFLSFSEDQYNSHVKKGITFALDLNTEILTRVSEERLDTGTLFAKNGIPKVSTKEHKLYYGAYGISVVSSLPKPIKFNYIYNKNNEFMYGLAYDERTNNMIAFTDRHILYRDINTFKITKKLNFKAPNRASLIADRITKDIQVFSTQESSNIALYDLKKGKFVKTYFPLKAENTRDVVDKYSNRLLIMDYERSPFSLVMFKFKDNVDLGSKIKKSNVKNNIVASNDSTIIKDEVYDQESYLIDLSNIPTENEFKEVGQIRTLLITGSLVTDNLDNSEKYANLLSWLDNQRNIKKLHLNLNINPLDHDTLKLYHDMFQKIKGVKYLVIHVYPVSGINQIESFKSIEKLEYFSVNDPISYNFGESEELTSNFEIPMHSNIRKIIFNYCALDSSKLKFVNLSNLESVSFYQCEINSKLDFTGIKRLEILNLLKVDLKNKDFTGTIKYLENLSYVPSGDDQNVNWILNLKNLEFCMLENNAVFDEKIFRKTFEKRGNYYDYESYDYFRKKQ